MHRPSIVDTGEFPVVGDATALENRNQAFPSFLSNRFLSIKWSQNKVKKVKSNVLGKSEMESSFLSRLLFIWVNPLIQRATEESLTSENLWPVNESSRSGYLSQKFEALWTLEMKKPPEQRSLAKCLYRMFRRQFIFTGFLNLLQNAVMLVQPNLIQAFLSWLESDTAPLWYGYFLAGLMFIIGSMINGLIASHLFIQLYAMGMNARTVLNSVVYRKSLCLSNSARQSTSTGEAVTLMSNDAEKIPQGALMAHNLWVTPLFLVAGITLLGRLVGLATLGGVMFLVFIIPIQGKLAFKAMFIQRGTMKYTTQRLKVVNEILQGIKIVKFYAWEASFKERVAAIRNIELANLRTYAILNAFTMSILMATSLVMVLITLLIYCNISTNFSPSIVFTAVSLLYVIRFPLMMLPMAIGSCINGLVSVKRIQRFLELDETNELDRVWENRSGTGKGNGRIEVNNAVFKWSVDSPVPELTKKDKKDQKKAAKAKKPKKSAVVMGEEEKDGSGDQDGQKSPGSVEVELNKEPFGKVSTWKIEVPSLDISGGILLAVVGMVGSGKSSFVSMLLGEMTKESGEVKLEGSVAYVAQTAWIMNATVKENIIMGRQLNEERYEQVIQACCLTQDLEMLPAQDRTEIGEKGINLSGGQKQRISLARAAYADADIYIFDDPLSAVDAHVGHHIFENLLLGMLASKTRVLCANQLHFLPKTDKVLVLKNGCVNEIGTFSELMKSKGEFFVLMNTFEGQSKEETKEEISQEHSEQETTSVKTKEKEAVKPAQADNKLIEAEGKAEGAVKWRVFRSYFVEGTGGWIIPLTVLCMTILAQGSTNVYEWWLSYWTGAYLRNPETTNGSKKNFYMFIYFGLAIFSVLLVLLRDFCFALQSIMCSRHLHAVLVDGIIRAPSSFFDTTPIGRIINRFSKDMDNIDVSLPRSGPQLVIMLSSLIGTIITIIVVLPWFGIPILPLIVAYYFVQMYYRPTARDLQRIESVSRSPIYAQFSETLNGVSTVRAYNLQQGFLTENERRLDSSNRPYYLLQAANRWLQLRLELLGGSITLVAAVLLASSKSTDLLPMNAGIAGLVLTYTQQITMGLNWTVRMGCETETRITSAERIKEYGELTPEAPETVEGERPAAGWPSSGEIQVQKLSMQYRPGLPFVLKEVSLTINGGEKVGIAGRTGSGKSSLMIALFRLVEPNEGHIVIDGMNAHKMGLKDLRSALSIIPQDPVMFCGTLRQNLDPFDSYDDAAVMDAIRSAHLDDFVQSSEHKLEMEICEGGENLSLGQRQLVCLARAILRRNKILVMDEATANIDMETDALIQETIKQKFKHCTVLTIAHRLHTIMDCDRVLIMEEGKVGEFDHPSILLKNERSLLTSLVEKTGAQTAKKLREIANRTFQQAPISNIEVETVQDM